MGWKYATLTNSPLKIAYAALTTAVTGLVVYGLTRLSTLVVELHEARTELAQMAVTQERLRFARDLHDLLGYSLSAITLKSELTHRLVTKDPAKAQDELVEILDISRKALGDVRSVASGYRELSLENESESARTLLLAADVAVTTEISCGDLPTSVKTVLATVLREGITNVLRHSNAERCEISMRQADGRVWLDIVNDGVQTNRAQPGGSGIQNLSARIAALHGCSSQELERTAGIGCTHGRRSTTAANDCDRQATRCRWMTMTFVTGKRPLAALSSPRPPCENSRQGRKQAMNENNASCLLTHGGTGPVLCITPWEKHALQLLADGHTRNELSRHLGASASEIDSLLEELFAAMGVATQAEAIAAAHKRGLFKEAWLAVDAHGS